MANGFRQQKGPSKKEQARQVQTEIKNLNMAVRISQMMTQQMVTTLQRLDRDVANSMGVLNDLQYRTLAILELNTVPKDQIEAKAQELKLRDYNEASDREDQEKNYTNGTVVEDNSIVILTSEAPDNKGIFRSKFKLSEAGVPALQQALLGKKVGDKVTVKLGDLEHQVELLGIRVEPVAVIAEVATEQPAAAEGASQ